MSGNCAVPMKEARYFTNANAVILGGKIIDVGNKHVGMSILDEDNACAVKCLPSSSTPVRCTRSPRLGFQLRHYQG